MSKTLSLPLVRLPSYASIHRFGTPTSEPRNNALLRFPEHGWTVEKGSSPTGQSSKRRPQGWAIVGDAEGRKLAVETLLSRHRIHPITPPPGPFPYIAHLTSESSSSDPDAGPVSISKPIRHLAFARPPISGEFTDYTARYGALQEEDKLSFRQTLSSLHPTPSEEAILSVAKTMHIDHLLDLPSVSLSSGQTRRARIAAALLTKPVLLLLEDPMAGLDIQSRDQVSDILGRINAEGERRMILVLRGKGGGGGMPHWITDICEVRKGEAWIGSREEWEARQSGQEHTASIHQVSDESSRSEATFESSTTKEPIVQLQDISISYGEGTRPVIKNVSWTIRPGEKWHLQGANGSGKTTLLSLILGHHPRSFSLPAESLMLFSKPRRRIPTPTLRTLIGHTSPEVYASFPRGMGLTASEAVGSGFEGIFSRRRLDPTQKERVSYLLDFFLPLLQPPHLGTSSDAAPSTVETVGKRLFAHFTPPQQALLLFLRAIVSRPKLLILDEPSQGMDEVIWAKCGEMLEREWEEMPDQAVIVISHYDDEVPWSKRRGKVVQLVDGRASIS